MTFTKQVDYNELCKYFFFLKCNNVLQVFQDIVLPINVLEKQIDVAEEIFDAYPILVYFILIIFFGSFFL